MILRESARIRRERGVKSKGEVCGEDHTTSFSWAAAGGRGMVTA